MIDVDGIISIARASVILGRERSLGVEQFKCYTYISLVERMNE